jgi:HAD superfamily hydrolase (TIGR01509 family)
VIEAILWDNDGVLVDTERLFFAANRDMFRGLGIELSEQDFFNWYLADNCGAWHLLDLTPAQIHHHRRRRDVQYSAMLAAGDQLEIDGMASLLADLAQRVKMAVVTSSRRDHFDLIHARLGFMQHVDFVLAAGDYASTKPSPEPYLLAQQRLGLTGDQCLAIEDSPRGLQAATAAGMRCIVVQNAMTRHYAFDGAYRVVQSIDALKMEIDALLATR